MKVKARKEILQARERGVSQNILHTDRAPQGEKSRQFGKRASPKTAITPETCRQLVLFVHRGKLWAVTSCQILCPLIKVDPRNIKGCVA
ncbi:hypothetical protein RRG08_059201 [Elysia crispata]|uniref:Uncharacterized protein n=1 Tax=Elysia crispata TaxID=231223 RepID=A0AAE0ZEF7_9GAST|nr:hypothetical protein RRG08_059201 [Elysia crispata]